MLSDLVLIVLIFNMLVLNTKLERKMYKILIYIIVTVFVFCIPVRAFEVGKFRAGMSETEALKIARRIDSSAIIDQLENVPMVSTLEFVDPGSTDKPPIKWGLSFCKSSLSELNRGYNVLRWDLLSQTVTRLNRRYGDGKIKPYRETGLHTELYGMELLWESNEDKVYILLQSVRYGNKNYKDRFYVFESYRSKMVDHNCMLNR